MNQKINIVDLGRIDYQTAWDFQKEFHKKVQLGKETDTLFLLEHDPVYTLGKNANKNALPSSTLIINAGKVINTKDPKTQ